MPLLRLVLAILLLGAVPAAAQVPGLALPKPQAAQAPSPDPAELEALARTLQDDAARARLIQQLQALAAAQPATARPALDHAVDRLSTAAAERVQVATETIGALGISVQAVPQLLTWIGAQLADPISRGLWWAILSQTGLVLALGAFSSLLLRRLLRAWRERRIARLDLARPGARLGAAAAYVLVDLTALTTFVAVTHAALGLLDVTYLARVITADIVRGVALVRVFSALWSAVLQPRSTQRRLVALGDHDAHHVKRWLETVLGLATYGFIGLDSALRLGLPWTVHAFLVHALFLVIIGFITTALLRLRPQIAALASGWGAGADSWIGRAVPWRLLGTAGPYALIGWLVLEYLVWAFRIRGGTALLTRGALVTIAAMVALWIFHIAVERLVAPPAAPVEGSPAAEVEQRPPSARRAGSIAVLRVLASLATLAIVLQGWGVDVTGLFDSDLGREVAGRLAGFALVTGTAGLAWYVFDRGATHYISAQDAEGNPVHSNRTRTLANLVRNFALTIAGLVVIGQLLAMVGVNPAALLAGAGVVGFAIGFGSQKLVQDLTTGLFILIGDTVRVGDVVQLGALAGVVEAVSMRTITLRDYNGNVHTIPYSAISIVTNMTKDYSYAVFDVLVGYDEDPDRIMQTLREIDGQLRREWPYRRLMLEPLDIGGLDAFMDQGVIIKARSKVRAGEQWKVGREFNLRLKKRFDELGIRRPFPQQTVHMRERAPAAPPKLTAVVGRGFEARSPGEA